MTVGCLNTDSCRPVYRVEATASPSSLWPGWDGGWAWVARCVCQMWE